MIVNKITKNEDGSSTLDFSLTDQETDLLVEYAVNDILKKYIKKLEDKQGDD